MLDQGAQSKGREPLSKPLDVADSALQQADWQFLARQASMMCQARAHHGSSTSS